MKKLAFGLAAIALLIGAVGWMASAVDAQEPQPVDPVPIIRPVPLVPGLCSSARLDLNGDGTVNKGDVRYWDEMARACIDEHGRPIPGGQCDPRLDLDGDGVVTEGDLYFLYNYVYTCLFPPNDLPR